MPNPAVHVMPDGDRWTVIRDGDDAPLSVHDTRTKAIRAGRELARRSQAEFVAHGSDGKILETDAYGDDRGGATA